jgi:transposase
MFNDAASMENVYIACGYTDLRYGIDSLAVLVRSKFTLDPFQTNTLFLFCDRKKDRIKGLFGGDGFLLLYKRPECGYVKTFVM